MLEIGLEATVELAVRNEDTARSMRSGDVDVLATPRMIALCEEATLLAVDGRLADGYTTVGLSVQVDHLRPSAVGEHIWAEAHLDRIEGRRLCFSVVARDERGLLGAGKVTRVVVEVERFMEKTR